jgi:hypothetical protein
MMTLKKSGGFGLGSSVTGLESVAATCVNGNEHFVCVKHGDFCD